MLWFFTLLRIFTMPKIKDLPKHKRPREKLAEKGAENLSDENIPIAKELISNRPDLGEMQIKLLQKKNN